LYHLKAVFLLYCFNVNNFVHAVLNISPLVAWILAKLVFGQSCRISKLSHGAYKKIIKRPKLLSFEQCHIQKNGSPCNSSSIKEY